MNQEESKIIAGIYVRVSTEEQAKEGFSIRGQTEKLRDYARIMGWEVYKVYADEGISGKNIIERPSINNMIEDVKKGIINTVLVFKIDRLTRNTKDLIELVDLFNRHQCNFNSLMESIDTKSASGRMFIKIIGIFAEFERENIVERVTLGMERKAREGYTLATHISSYGYDKVKDQKIQSINLEEAKIVQEIFDRYTEQNEAMHHIASELNLRGVITKKGSFWTAKTVKLILTNVNYIGKVRYSIKDKTRYFDTDGKHEGFISEEQFAIAQRKIAEIEPKLRTKRPKEANFFVGTIYCGVCGRKLVTHGCYRTHKDGTRYFIGQYRCRGKMMKVCTAKDIGSKKAEEKFLEYINNIQDLEIDDDIQINTPLDTSTIESYDKKIEQLEHKETQIMSMFLDEKIEFDEYSKMSQKLRKDIDFISRELKKLQEQQKSEIEMISKEDVITSIKENWQYLTDHEKLAFVHNFIKKIVIYSEPQKNTQRGNVIIKTVEFYDE